MAPTCVEACLFPQILWDSWVPCSDNTKKTFLILLITENRLNRECMLGRKYILRMRARNWQISKRILFSNPAAGPRIDERVCHRQIAWGLAYPCEVKQSRFKRLRQSKFFCILPTDRPWFCPFSVIALLGKLYNPWVLLMNSKFSSTIT